MKNTLKGKTGTVLILLVTFILAGVAIFTAIRLYQLRSQPVAPNVPSSIPLAAENPTPNPACALNFTLGSSETTEPTTTATATSTSTSAPTTTPTGAGGGGGNNPSPTQPSLPVSGTNWPTLVGIGVGILTIVGSLVIAL